MDALGPLGTQILDGRVRQTCLGNLIVSLPALELPHPFASLAYDDNRVKSPGDHIQYQEPSAHLEITNKRLQSSTRPFPPCAWANLLS